MIKNIKENVKNKREVVVKLLQLFEDRGYDVASSVDEVIEEGEIVLGDPANFDTIDGEVEIIENYIVSSCFTRNADEWFSSDEPIGVEEFVDRYFWSPNSIFISIKFYRTRLSILEIIIAKKIKEWKC